VRSGCGGRRRRADGDGDPAANPEDAPPRRRRCSTRRVVGRAPRADRASLTTMTSPLTRTGFEDLMVASAVPEAVLKEDCCAPAMRLTLGALGQSRRRDQPKSYFIFCLRPEPLADIGEAPTRAARIALRGALGYGARSSR